MSGTTISGPHYTEYERAFFRIIDKEGAEVAQVYAVSHGADASVEDARKLANRRALAVAKLIDDDIREHGVL